MRTFTEAKADLHEFDGFATVVDYIFVDHTRLDVKMKTNVLNNKVTSIADLPYAHASLCGLIVETEPPLNMLSELVLRPVRLYNDPFRGHPHKIALCDVMKDLSTPADINTRHKLVACEKVIASFDPLIGFEQEYVISGEYRKQRGAFPRKNSYHDYVGKMPTVHVERNLTEEHMWACLKAGLHFCGITREKAESQWEYQLGPASPVNIADDLVVSRYILARLAEKCDVTVTFDPVPDISCFTSALHVNFSTKKMREAKGLQHIEQTLQRFSRQPQEELLTSFDRRGGKDNIHRLVGNTSRPKASGVTIGGKQAALRIPAVVQLLGKGYLEERRPSADADPYTVLAAFLPAMMNALESI